MVIEMIDSAWRSLAIGAAAWVALKIMRLEDLKTRKAVWTAVLAAACLMPLWRIARIETVRWQAPSVLSRMVGNHLSVAAGATARRPASLDRRPSEHEKQPTFSLIKSVVFLYWTVTVVLLARLLTGLLFALTSGAERKAWSHRDCRPSFVLARASRYPSQSLQELCCRLLSRIGIRRSWTRS